MDFVIIFVLLFIVVDQISTEMCCYNHNFFFSKLVHSLRTLSDITVL